MKITIVSSSTRKGRLSHRIALCLKKEIEKAGHDVNIIDLLELQLPVFHERLAFLENPKKELVDVQQRLEDSGAFIFVTPEYNGGISSGLKNFIDVFAKKPFDGKPIGVATGSTGMMGGIRAAYQLQQIILSISGYPQPQMLTVAQMDKQLDENGNVINESFNKSLERFLTAFLGFIERF